MIYILVYLYYNHYAESDVHLRKINLYSSLFILQLFLKCPCYCKYKIYILVYLYYNKKQQIVHVMTKEIYILVYLYYNILSCISFSLISINLYSSLFILQHKAKAVLTEYDDEFIFQFIYITTKLGRQNIQRKYNLYSSLFILQRITASFICCACASFIFQFIYITTLCLYLL